MAHTQSAQEDELAMSTEDLLQAQLELYHHSLAYVRSMALRAAVDLSLPDAIHRRGGGATLPDLAADTGLHHTKLPHLRRLMRALAVSGVFTAQDNGGGEAVYGLSRVSRLLVGGGSRQHQQQGLSLMVGALVNPAAVTALFSMREWLTDERVAAVSLFEVAHGCTRWEMLAREGGDGAAFNAGMDADSRVVAEVLLGERRGVLELAQDPHTLTLGRRWKTMNSAHSTMATNAPAALTAPSLVDVGGGAHGVVAAAIAREFPHVKCTVLDLPHVVAGAPAGLNVQFVAGDMFEYIPPADAVLIKWTLHCWQDDDCVKILRRCKEAIPARDAGGKVIIIDMVVGSADSQDSVSKETQALFDVLIMYVDGVQREEHQWRNIFLEAGFSDYKITPIHGFRSLIEVYP
ncbi:hypothetical protein ACP70R_019763 [Stipagrostis hirtigluma subsp. patula]